MEFDLWFNFVPIFSVILLTVVTIITVVQKLKLRWPVQVNCWFCNTNTKIWRQQLNWWMCPHCEQYNGFSKNGDYAYNIPEQYKTSANENKRYCTVRQDTLANKVANNDLCAQCNIKETLKISKLSKYVPTSERNYEYEIKQFKDSLEQQYPLCANCKITVHNVLRKQALWLAEYKMLFFKKKPFNSTKYSEPVCRTISTILSSMIAYNMDFVYLPIGGLFFQVCAHWSSSSRKRNSDTFLIFFWICMIVLLPFKDAKLIKTDLQNAWFSLEYITSYHMIMLFILAIGFTNIKPKSHKSTINKNMSFKKIESSTKDTTLPDLYTNVLNEHNFNSKAANDLNKTITNESLFSSNTTKQTPFYTENSVNSKVTSFQTPFQNHESQLSSAKDSNAIFNSVLSNKKSVIENFSLNDSLSTLSMLSLSEDKPKYTIKAPKIFEKKVYGTNSLELFRKANKRNILSPPKLKSFTQTSWVAGGYWQEDIDVPPLSRSSSQSSGFGSTCSNFAPSREPSVHEFDQCSVMSDVTQSCSTLRQNNIHPVGSFNQQNAYFSFPEPKSLVSNQTMRCASPNFYASQSFLLPEAYKKNNSVFIDQSLQGQNVNIEVHVLLCAHTSCPLMFLACTLVHLILVLDQVYSLEIICFVHLLTMSSLHMAVLNSSS
ncbi:uncharacterized protein LOC100879812 isoform X2 [Megachile rotundata]|uniref:uncharacterized protein LOC100879812 isoform X2 n=1 Tax=Megachile rotundata TaxID=143995 RepID=UPI003FD3F86C